MKSKIIYLSALLTAAVACQNPPPPVTPPEVTAPEFTQNAIDLSKDATANCYILKPSAAYSFSVSSKGNSSTELIQGGTGLKLVWQDKKSLVKELYYGAEDNTAYVLVGEDSGNALLAVCDDAGEILWSWHLWVTDYDPAASLYSTAPNASGTTWSFMDRNLGALSTSREGFDSHGLFYQWGRKDPFPGAATYTEMNADYSYSKDGEPELYDIDNNVLPTILSKVQYYGDIAKSISNPDVFYAMTYRNTGVLDEYGEEIVENVPKSGDWTDQSDDDFWGGISMKKTIYDPCPPGYKVPVCDADGNTPYDWMVYADMTWDNDNFGADQYGQWYPATGTRVYASGGLDFTDPSVVGYSYAGMWIGTAGKAADDIITYPTLYGQYMMIVDGKRTYKVQKDKRSQGMSLRCVVE